VVMHTHANTLIHTLTQTQTHTNTHTPTHTHAHTHTTTHTHTQRHTQHTHTQTSTLHAPAPWHGTHYLAGGCEAQPWLRTECAVRRGAGCHQQTQLLVHITSHEGICSGVAAHRRRVADVCVCCEIRM
jgi:hypothetical protein